MDVLTDPHNDRLRKVKALRDAGIDPYPARAFKRTHTVGEVIGQHTRLIEERPPVTLAGRVVGIRRMGKTVFVDLLDQGQRLQLMLRQSNLDSDAWCVVKHLDAGDHVGTSGKIILTRTGELTHAVDAVVILSKAAQAMPLGKVDGSGITHSHLSDRGARLRQRHVVLTTDPSFRQIIIKRSRILSAIRHYFTGHGFVELDTPILGSSYGGAAARPFTTHVNALGVDMYMRISLEPPLKRAVCGGLDRVFEIGHTFRNEGLDHSHSPEFCMMEWYEAYTDYLDQMHRFEELIPLLAEASNNSSKISYRGRVVDLVGPWHRMPVLEALRHEIGIDLLGVPIEDMAKFYKEFHPMREGGLPANAIWGDAVMKLFEALIEPRLWEPTFIMDYPADMSPLTKRHRSNPMLAERFEPSIAGVEIGNCYSELNDPWEQFERLIQQNRDREEAYDYDADFISAVAHGMPQCGGAGLGIDRLVMLITGSESIKDVHLFPMVGRTGED